MALPQFDYVAPATIEEALQALAAGGTRARILAGGTDLLLQLRERAVQADRLIDIGGLAALRGIAPNPGGGIAIGACTRIAELERSAPLRERYRALHQAAHELGSTQIRFMATLGGNACNASPAAETPPPLIALGATVTLASARGRRSLALEEFVRGARQTALAQDELLERFDLPAPWPRSASRYAYAGLREAMEIDLANVAVNVGLDARRAAVEHVRIAMGAVGPVPTRARRAEEALLGKAPDEAAIAAAAQAAAAEAKPIDDLRASAAYRRSVLKTLVARALAAAVDAIRAEAGGQ